MHVLKYACLYHIILCITFAHAVYNYALYKNRLIVKTKLGILSESTEWCAVRMKCRDGGYIYPLRIDEFYIIYEIDA